MKGSFSVLTAILAFSSTSCATRQDQKPQERVELVPGVYLVEFNDDADTDTARLYRGISRDLGLDVEPRLDLSSDVFKGASFTLKNVSESDTEALATSILSDARIKNVWPVQKINIPSMNSTLRGHGAAERHQKMLRAAEDKYMPHVMTQVDQLHAEGIRGAGIRIGIVDTGIDYNHPALGGCFGPGCLVAYGYDFAGDDATSTVPIPDADPMDNCHGHGTHVAGIIAAQQNEYGVLGAAPDVTIGMYKVMSACGGVSTTDLVLAGILRAYEDGNDIISCSIGGETGWANEPLSVAVDRIVAAGTPVVVSAGNTPQAWTILTPASGRRVTAVGSVANRKRPAFVTVGSFTIDGGEDTRFVMGPAVPGFDANVTKPLWAVSLDTEAENDACEPLPDDTPDLSDVVVLVRASNWMTGCPPWIQADNIFNRGGKHILFYQRYDADVAELLELFISGTESASVKASQGQAFVKALAAGKNVTVTITAPQFGETVLENVLDTAVGGYMSEFSTWGPSWEVEVKPQIASPGGHILSTMPIDMGSWGINSGTSMAAPLVAAIYALVAEVRGTFDPELLRKAVSGSAKPLNWQPRGAPAQLNAFAPVAQQGAGLIQAYHAAHSTVILSVSSLSFNDSANFVPKRTFTIYNSGNSAVSFKLGHSASVTALTYEIIDDYRVPTQNTSAVNAPATLTFNKNSVSIPARGSANVTVTLTAPTGLNLKQVPIYSGFISLNSSSSAVPSLSLPYLGVAGKLRDIPIFDHPLGTASLIDSAMWTVEANHTFTIPQPGGAPVDSSLVSLPAAYVQSWIVGIPLLRIDLVPLASGTRKDLTYYDFFGVRTLGQFHPPTRWVYRFNTVLSFNGQLPDGTVVPEGRYRLRIGALRVNGNERKKEDWELVDTIPFELKYESA
ncbi:putative serine endopeptidase protein [Paramyrothecium foliicola]|nr:putative serine endopeptidase protein [Paramyrothecium foliicola]